MPRFGVEAVAIGLECAGAKVLKLAAVAIGFAGGAATASVEDEPVAEIGPSGAWEKLDEIFFDFDRIGIPGEAEPGGETSDVGVDDDAIVDGEGVAEDDIGGLASDSGQGGEGGHGAGDMAVVEFADLRGGGADVAGFVAEESGGVDEGFELFLRDGGKGLGGGAADEEGGGDHVDPLVRALRGEDGGDEELERVGEGEFAVRIGVDAREADGELRGALGAGH